MFPTRIMCLVGLLRAFTCALPSNTSSQHLCENDPLDNDPTNTRMVGDLTTPTTPVGSSIANILLRKESAESCENHYDPPGLAGTKACQEDTCCVWSWVSKVLIDAFDGGNGLCNDNARAAVRLGFHDAGTWSQNLASLGQDYGGADGSLILSGTELNRPDNNGLQDIAKKMQAWQKQFCVPMSDLIQFAAIHAVVSCPLGPRIRFFVGRTDSSRPAPDGLLPQATSDADTLIDLFDDKTISPHELAALVGAHTASRQFHFDESRAGSPQDSTPGVWDTLFYNETLADTPNDVDRFPSDINLANDPRVADEWAEFRQGDGEGQRHWNSDYARAYVRLSLLGVKNINQMTECSKVLPSRSTEVSNVTRLRGNRRRQYWSTPRA